MFLIILPYPTCVLWFSLVGWSVTVLANNTRQHYNKYIPLIMIDDNTESNDYQRSVGQIFQSLWSSSAECVSYPERVKQPSSASLIRRMDLRTQHQAKRDSHSNNGIQHLRFLNIKCWLVHKPMITPRSIPTDFSHFKWTHWCQENSLSRAYTRWEQGCRFIFGHC